jgi:uncharacterized protein (UPF0179 family)
MRLHSSFSSHIIELQRESDSKNLFLFNRWVKRSEGASMEIDYRPSTVDANVVHLAGYLGMAEPVGHRCDRRCNVEHVWANLYRCKSSNVTHVRDKNCNQKILYDNHTSVCRVSRKFSPLTSAEQEAIRGVRRKRDQSDCVETCGSYKRRHELRPSASGFESSFKLVVPPVSGRFNSGASSMDIN